MIFLTAQRLPSRYQTQIDEDKSFRLRDAIDETVGLGRVVRRTKFEDELMLLAQIDLLQVSAFGEVPEVQPPSVFGTENELRNEAVLEHVGGAPLARYHRVVPEMPPGVIAELLRPTIDLPSAKRLEAFVVHYENPV